jgi:putative DNA primase/helicase
MTMEHCSNENTCVPGTSLIGWAAIGGARIDGGWTYPERNAQGETIARMTRWDAPAEGQPKYTAAKGAKRGLIMRWPLANYAGSSPEDPLLLTEGASDTACAESLTLDAVGRCNAGGAIELLAELCKGLHVAIVPDVDEAGRRSTPKLVAALSEVCASVRVANLPAGYKDLRGWVCEGGATRDDVLRMAREAKPTAAEASRGPVLTCMADVAPAAIEWLWNGKLAIGCLTTLAGYPGKGKSFVTTDLAARVSRGKPWPDGSPCARGSVLIISAEDDPARVIRPRLDAHGADVRKVHLLTMVRRGQDERGEPIDAMFTLADVAALRQALERIGDVRLLVVDPVGSFVGGTVDTYKDNELRAVLAPVDALANEYGTAALLVAHPRKGASTRADDMVLGSRALTAISRAVWHLVQDKDDEERRLLLPGKNNLARMADGLAFTIGGEPAAIQWEPEPIRMSADDGLAEHEAGGPKPGTRLADATGWLRAYLDGAGAVPGKVVMADGKAAGHSSRTLERARDELQVTTRPMGMGQPWVWELQPFAEYAKPNPLAASGGVWRTLEDTQ